jgi:hypothetical protein
MYGTFAARIELPHRKVQPQMEQDLQNTFQNSFKFEKPNELYRLFYHPTEKVVDRKTVKLLTYSLPNKH